MNQHSLSQTARAATLRREAIAYYALCDEARMLGIPTSLDDPRSATTVEGLRAEVERGRERERA